MSYRATDFPYLRNNYPEELKSTILRTLRDYKGNISETAEHFGFSRAYFYRYIRDLGIQAEVAGIKDEFGKQFRAGRKKRYSDSKAKGASREAEFLERVATDPDGAKQLILWAFEDAGGNYAATLTSLGVSSKAWGRVTEELGIQGELRRLEERFRLARLTEGRLLFRKDRHSLYSAVASSGPA